MMTIKRSLILLVTLFNLLLLMGCGTSIRGGEMGMQFKSFHGGVQKKIHSDGFKWHLPWNPVVIYDVRWQTKRESVHVVTRDNLNVAVDVSIGLRPSMAELYELHMEIGPNFYQEVVQPAFLAIAEAVFSTYSYDEIPEAIPEIQKILAAQTHETLDGKHLQINSIIIENVHFPSEVEAAVEAKLAKKEEIVQKEFELEIAQKDAEIRRIEAEGLAESQRAVADHLTKEYLQFLFIEVQRELAKSSNKTFIFVPVGAGGIPLLLNMDKQ